MSIREAVPLPMVERLVMISKAHLETLPDGTKTLKRDSAAVLRQEPGPIFSMIGGNAHNVFGLVYPRRPFDFYHPDHPDRQPQRAWIIPYEQVRDSLMRLANFRLNDFRALVAACPGRVIHLESPPPIPNQAWLTEKLAKRMEIAGITEFEVAAPSVRYKLWRVNSMLFREECARHEVPFIPVPPEACNERGFLLKRYWRDPTHANGCYGELLQGQMMEHVNAASV